MINTRDCGVHADLCPQDIPAQTVWEGEEKGLRRSADT